MLRDTVDFIKASVRHWASLLTGGVVMAFVGMWEHSRHAVPPNIYWMIAVISLFIACFKAWRDERATSKDLISELALAKVPSKIGWQDLYSEKKRLQEELESEIKRQIALGATFEAENPGAMPEDIQYYLSVSDPDEYQRIQRSIERLREDIEIVKNKMNSLK